MKIPSCPACDAEIGFIDSCRVRMTKYKCRICSTCLKSSNRKQRTLGLALFSAIFFFNQSDAYSGRVKFFVVLSILALLAIFEYLSTKVVCCDINDRAA